MRSKFALLCGAAALALTLGSGVVMAGEGGYGGYGGDCSPAPSPTPTPSPQGGAGGPPMQIKIFCGHRTVEYLGYFDAYDCRWHVYQDGPNKRVFRFELPKDTSGNYYIP